MIAYIFDGLSFINELSPEQQEDLKSELTNSFNKMEKRIDRICSSNPNLNVSINRDVYDILYICAHKPENDGC